VKEKTALTEVFRLGSELRTLYWYVAEGCSEDRRIWWSDTRLALRTVIEAVDPEGQYSTMESEASSVVQLIVAALRLIPPERTPVSTGGVMSAAGTVVVVTGGAVVVVTGGAVVVVTGAAVVVVTGAAPAVA